jgi:hypothetical protein
VEPVRPLVTFAGARSRLIAYIKIQRCETTAAVRPAWDKPVPNMVGPRPVARALVDSLGRLIPYCPTFIDNVGRPRLVFRCRAVRFSRCSRRGPYEDASTGKLGFLSR